MRDFVSSGGLRAGDPYPANLRYVVVMSRTSAIFMLAADGTLVEMLEAPYDSESVLQELLEDHPRLLGGDLMGHHAPRKFVMVSREVSLVGEERGVGRIDHVFLDQEGIPTLVEVKRSSDTRIRREVVGQLLDYAANAVAYWPVEDIRARFETRSIDFGIDPDARLADVLGDEGPDAYWARVGSNLAAGRLRLVFVADEIPSELRRVIEFLNEQMRPAEVLGVEVKQYVDEQNQVRNLVPRVIGITAASENKIGRGTRQWTEAEFFEAFDERAPNESAIARRLLEWARPRFAGIRWGYGRIDGSFYPQLFAGRPQSLFVVYTNATIEIRFGSISGVPPFDAAQERDALRAELNQIPGWNLPPESSKRFPTAPLQALGSGSSFAHFTEVMERAATRMVESQQPKFTSVEGWEVSRPDDSGGATAD